MTPDEYHAAVVAEVVRQTRWTEQEARNVTGSVADMEALMEDGYTPADAASEILFDGSDA